MNRQIANIIKFIEFPLVCFNKAELWSVFLICFISVSLWGQSLSQVELRYQDTLQEFFTQQFKLDSINTIHNKLIDAINKEKQKEPNDKNKIKEMLASAVVVSNQIKEQQSVLENIESDLETLKVNLDRKYAIKVDSLKNLEESTDNSADKETIKTQKLKYIEKRLIVAPKIYSLSFDPERLLQFTYNFEEDSLIKKMYQEYVSNALEEVSLQSQQLAVLKNEITEVVSLQNEAYDFIENVDSEILFNPALQFSPIFEKNDAAYLGGSPTRIDEEFSNIYGQANSYLHIFNQLKTSTNIDAQSLWNTPTDTIPANLTFQQYLELLENVDKMLKDYKTILEHKLESY